MSPIMGLLPGRPTESLRSRLRRDRPDPVGRTSQIHRNPRTTVSPRHLGTVLAEAGLCFQRTRTWKASPDPCYEEKVARILVLCEKPPRDGPVVSFDQM